MKNTFQSFLTSIMAAVIIVAGTSVLVRAASDCTGVNTANGPVDGVSTFKGRMCEYLGIPYAAPPVGDLRFAPPAPAEAWTEPLQAAEYGDICLQYPLSFYEEPTLSGSEDCLSLNVWQPVKESGELLPVMVFIHGGGFRFGASSEEVYEGSKLAGMGGVVLVSMNYRLGPMGFFSHPALTAEGGTISNYGLYDQIAALKWVKQNIESFGGDPENITIFGESAGGMSVGILLATPLTEGLFNKAIIQSGPLLRFGYTVEDAEKKGLELAADLGCGDSANALECLRTIDAARFYDFVSGGLSMSMSKTDGKKTYNFRPVIDGDLVPESMGARLQGGNYHKNVDVVMGFNDDEASLFTIGTNLETEEEYKAKVIETMEERGADFGLDTSIVDELLALYPAENYETPMAAYVDLLSDMIFACPTVMAADSMAANGTNVYEYMFAKSPSNLNIGIDLGAFHAVELLYIFNNFKYMGFNIESKSNKAFAKKMVGLWSSFAVTGIPGTGDFPAWEKYTADSGKYLYINEEPAIMQDYKKQQCDYMADVFKAIY